MAKKKEKGIMQHFIIENPMSVHGWKTFYDNDAGCYLESVVLSIPLSADSSSRAQECRSFRWGQIRLEGIGALENCHQQ